MALGHLHHSSGVDGLGWTAWGRLNLWELSTGISSAFRTRSTKMDDVEHAAILDMPELWNGLQGFDCHD